jgi:hypothetical protein
MGVGRGGGAGELREQERGWTTVGEGLLTLKHQFLIKASSVSWLRPSPPPSKLAEPRRDCARSLQRTLFDLLASARDLTIHKVTQNKTDATEPRRCTPS